MVSVGVSFEGFPHFTFTELENGRIIPSGSIDELNDSHKESLRNQVEMAVEAEELGYDYIVHAEHHADTLWANSPNPLITQTAIARETNQVRLLQMANILPWHEPIRLAEQLSMLDILSDGRISVGIGHGAGDPAAETIGQYWGETPLDTESNRQLFEERYHILLEAWNDDFVSYRGQYHHVPQGNTEFTDGSRVHYFSTDDSETDLEDRLSPRSDPPTQTSLAVLPEPDQSPHPQLWKPALSPESAEWAAQREMNICTHLMDISDTRELLDAYYEAAEAAGWPDHRDDRDGTPLRRGWDDRCNRGVGIIFPVFNTAVASDETRNRWLQSRQYAKSRDDDVVFDGQLPCDCPESMQADPQLYRVDIDDLEADDVPIIGDAAEIAAQLNHIRDALELEDAFFIIDIECIGLTYEERVDQLRAFATEVRPALEQNHGRD